MITISRLVLRNLPTMTADQVEAVKVAAGLVPLHLIKGVEEFNLYKKVLRRKRPNREETWQTLMNIPVSSAPEEYMEVYVELRRMYQGGVRQVLFVRYGVSKEPKEPA